jgi:aldehyde:ferredoxin oxidoreductase
VTFGYNNRLAWVDLTNRRIEYVEPSQRMLDGVLGGRGLGAAILYKHARTVQPLAVESLFCVMVGPLTGTGFPLANRLAFVFRSPLTGTIAWANTGGYAGSALKNAGLDGIVVEGGASEPVYLFVENGRGIIYDAAPLWGQAATATVTQLRHEHGDVRVLAIGPAGENLVKLATVVNDTGRTSGVRHGPGCVMGSKNLKAIVVKGGHIPRVSFANKAAHLQQARVILGKLRQSPLLNHETGLLAVHGTPIASDALGKNDALPFRNYHYTTMEGYEQVGGKHMTGTILITRLTCSYCPVSCRRETTSTGKYGFRAEGPDYAQISSLGTNCAITDLEAIAYMNHLCYELGLDPIEMGNTLAMLAEYTEHQDTKDGLKWGDVDRMVELIQSTAARRGVGELLGMGAAEAAARLGAPALSMSVKGITIQNTDPRAEPAWGLLNATENFGGAVHIWVYGKLVYGLRDAGVEVVVGPHDTAADLAQRVKRGQDLVALLDSLQVCAFSSYAFALEDYAAALNNVTGRGVGSDELLGIGERIFTLERMFNEANGFGPADDSLPTRFLAEPVPSGQHRGKVCLLGPMLQNYYTSRGWPDGHVPARQSTDVSSLL